MAICGTLGSSIATLSPGLTPMSISALAKLLTIERNCLYVIFASMKMSALLSGNSSQVFSIPSTTVITSYLSDSGIPGAYDFNQGLSIENLLYVCFIEKVPRDQRR